MDHLHTANKVCGGCCAISLNTVDTESSVSPIIVITCIIIKCFHLFDCVLCLLYCLMMKRLMTYFQENAAFCLLVRIMAIILLWVTLT